jgi:hypothetical protein
MSHVNAIKRPDGNHRITDLNEIFNMWIDLHRFAKLAYLCCFFLTDVIDHFHHFMSIFKPEFPDPSAAQARKIGAIV